MKLLDTSILIGLLRGDEEIKELLSQEEKMLCTCFPVQCELYRGTRLARRTEEGEDEVDSLMDELESLEANRDSAKKVNDLREKYSEINHFDLMIAGICIANNAQIMTKDKDFERIEELDAQII